MKPKNAAQLRSEYPHGSRTVTKHETLLKLSFAGYMLLFTITFAIYMLRMQPVMLAAQSA